jgi:hypothetical protein
MVEQMDSQMVVWLVVVWVTLTVVMMDTRTATRSERNLAAMTVRAKELMMDALRGRWTDALTVLLKAVRTVANSEEYSVVRLVDL